MGWTVDRGLGRLNGEYFHRIQIFLLTSDSAKSVNDVL